MELPPIEYFYGRTPMAIWISKCKPFEPKGLGKSVMYANIKNFEISPPMRMYIHHLEEVRLKLEQDMADYFSRINIYLKEVNQEGGKYEN